MINDIEKKQQLYIIKKIINIAIRATYYIFCCRNTCRNWNSPDLMQFWFLFFLFLFLFCFVLFCFFNNPITSSICKLPIRSKIYNCTFKNTNKVSIIIIVIIVSIINIQWNSKGTFWANEVCMASVYYPTLTPVHLVHHVSTCLSHFNIIEGPTVAWQVTV